MVRAANESGQSLTSMVWGGELLLYLSCVKILNIESSGARCLGGDTGTEKVNFITRGAAKCMFVDL